MKRAVVVVFCVVAAACGHKDSSSGAGSSSASSAPPPPPAPSLAESCKAICTKNVSCGGVTGAEAKSKQADCEQVCNGQANGDPLAAELVPQAMAKVAAACTKVDCAKFGDCYMDTLTAFQSDLGVPTQPAAPISPEMRTRFVTLVCDVVAESPGKIPDLNDPTPSPKLQELKMLASEIVDQQHSATGIADLMKEAMATCNPAR